MKICWLAICSAVLLAAQVRSVGMKPTSQPATDAGSSHSLAGAPVLGYVLGPRPVELHAVLGTVGAPHLGDSIAVPEKSKGLYLPPRQRYALVEHSTDEAVAVWAMHKAFVSGMKQEPVAIKGAMAHPDLVAFSPRGNALVLYSERDSKVQVVINLPAEALVSRELSLSIGVPSLMAVSDDAALVVALAGNSLLSSWNGEAWRPLSGGFTPDAWSFVPNTRHLVISDRAQRVIVLLPNINETSMASRVLAQDVHADYVAVSKGGEQIVAADLGGGQIWAIDLETGTVTPAKGVARGDTLSSLRDGFTFLVSSSPRLSLLRLTEEPDLRNSATHFETGGLVQNAAAYH